MGYSGSDIMEKDASSEMGTDNSTEELKGYPTVLVWALSTGVFSRYKVIKAMARRLRFGINCVKSDNFRSNRPENQSGPLFSAASSPEKRASGGGHPPEGGLSAGAGSGGEKWLGSLHNERASLARMAFERGIYA